jgi:GcrA cell cycle regulator
MLIWPDHHVKAIQTLRALGYSYSRVTKEINAKFATSYTRSAVISKTRRVSLNGLGNPPPSLRTETERVKHDMAPAGRLIWPPPPLPPLSDRTTLRFADVIPRHLSLLELMPRQCRYPYGEGPFTFCGHPTRPGVSYCPGHQDLVAGPAVIAERDAVLLSLTSEVT